MKTFLVELDEADLHALELVIDYLIEDEQDHYDDMQEAGEDTSDHIYLSYRHLEQLMEEIASGKRTPPPPSIL